VQTGDIICTTDGGGEIFAGQFWRLVGKLIPGEVDHIAVYVGPQGRCVEAGAKGRVITNTGKGIPEIPGTGSIIFPQEIWSG